MSFGPNPAQESVLLFLEHEKYIHQKIDTINQAIEGLTEEMDDLEYFLNLLCEETEKAKDKHHIELKNEDIKRIQKLAKNPALEHIFPPTKFSWLDEEIREVSEKLQETFTEWGQDEHLKNLITQRIEGPLQREIHRKTEEIMIENSEIGKVLDLFKAGLQKCQNLIDRILSNIVRAR